MPSTVSCAGNLHRLAGVSACSVRHGRSKESREGVRVRGCEQLLLAVESMSLRRARVRVIADCSPRGVAIQIMRGANVLGLQSLVGIGRTRRVG